ncbi:hypothetical protein FQZ97_978960 [compost metagenome]
MRIGQLLRVAALQLEGHQLGMDEPARPLHQRLAAQLHREFAESLQHRLLVALLRFPLASEDGGQHGASCRQYFLLQVAQQLQLVEGVELRDPERRGADHHFLGRAHQVLPPTTLIAGPVSMTHSRLPTLAA